MKEQVVVIGCGDLGARLAQQLDASHYRVLGLRRSPLSASHNLEYSMADYTDPACLVAALPSSCAVVVLTLTPASFSAAGYQQCYVRGSASVLEALRTTDCHPRLLLFVSSTSVYAQDDGQWVDEDSATEPTRFSGKHILEAEQLLLGSEFNTLILRCSGIYGPGRHRLLQRVWQGRTGEGDNFSNRIHADDCAAAMAHLIDWQKRQAALPAVLLASDCQPVPSREVTTWLAEQLRRPHSAPVETKPGGKRCSNRRLLETGFSFRYPDYRSGYRLLLPAFLQAMGKPND